MSKQQVAKDNQGYVEKAIPQTCQHCEHFLFDRVQTVKPTEWNPKGWFEDKKLRCAIGGFTVLKMGTCDLFVAKGNETDIEAMAVPAARFAV